MVTDISPSDDINALARKVAFRSTKSINDTLSILNLREFERGIDAIVKARKVEFYGVGLQDLQPLMLSTSFYV